LSGQQDRIANAANLAALLFHELEDVSWVGFYFLQGDQLIVGPFQGRPACVSIPLGRGVCGTAAATQQVQNVLDVQEFDGHIACDVNSRSEIVIPLIRDDKVLGVLDLDSPSPGRFDEDDQALLSEVARIYLESID
jgi:GAF domain-containing protein